MDDRAYFDACRNMFMTDGWELFQEELKIAIDAISLDSINSSEEFWKAKGRFEALTQMNRWESFVKAAEEQYDASDS
jgi:hypothetical protein